MNNLYKFAAIFAVSVGAIFAANALQGEPVAKLGETAPNFSLKDIDGKTADLSAMRGKYIILEWWNCDCPFVKKFYGSGTMQKLQKEMTDDGVVWVTICSSSEGKEGYQTEESAKAKRKEVGMNSSHVILDPKGTLGKIWGAKTTPHMFIIDPKGTIIYNGAIDSIRSANPADIGKAENYVVKAYKESKAGQPVTTPKSQPYGCSVKYAD